MGGWGVWPGGVSRPTSRVGWGEEVGGSGQGVSRPTTKEGG